MRLQTQRNYVLGVSLGVAFVLGGLFVHFLFPRLLEVATKELRGVSVASTLPFINPLLECGEVNGTLPRNIKVVEESVRTYIQVQKGNGTLTDVGVYYRDLNNGPWFGIDQSKEFSPGSLLKVPLLFAIYKVSETTPGFFDKKIEYAGGTSTASQEILVGDPISPGHVYTVHELVTHMIQQSDNNAALLLYQLLGYELTAVTYKDLGIVPPSVDKDYRISVRGYSTFFRLLFNATYLSKEDSNEALKLLSNSEFKDGLVAGVPVGTTVSHKFGERTFEGDTSGKQLHDCGIIYKPGHPYVLCIMTVGHDTKRLASIIADISRIVYENNND